MKTDTKILIGFLSIIVLILGQVGIAHKLQSDFYDDTLQIKEIEAPLGLMVEQVIGYDAILTGQVHNALLCSQSGNFDIVEHRLAEHRARYDEIGTKLDDLLKKDARRLIMRSKRPQETKAAVLEILARLDVLNLKLVDLELKAFEAIGKNDTETAHALVVGGDYDKYKLELYQNYRAWADIEQEVTLNIQNMILKQSQQIIYLNLGISIGIMIMVIMTMLTIRSFVAGKEKELDVREKMEQKYRILFENATDAIFIADIETRQLVECNKSAEKLTGYSRAEILSMKADELHPKDKVKETMNGFKKQAEGKIKSVFTEVLTKNNKRIPVKINASAVEIGNKRYNQGIFIERK